MQLPFSLFLAFRYILPRRFFLLVISIISVTGIALGICTLVVVIAVMRGFDTELKKKITGFEPHIQVMSATDIKNWRELAEKLEKIPDVIGVSPVVAGRILAQFQNQRLAPTVRAIDPAMDEPLTHLSKHIVAGEATLESDQAVIGEELAGALGVWVGDRITLISPNSFSQILDKIEEVESSGGQSKSIEELKSLVVPQDVTITGVFRSGRFPIDADVLMVPLFIGQELFNLDDGVHSIGIALKDPYRAEFMQDQVDRVLMDFEEPLYSRTWIEMNQYFFDAVKMERNMIFTLLLFIVLVAAFSVMNTLITVTVLKTREIGILKAVGARVSQIAWVFLFQGMIVGFIGNMVGVGIGLLFLHFRNPFREFLGQRLGIEVFPAKVYQFSELPADVNPQDLALILGVSFVICCFAAVVPAVIAARLDPVKALRFD